jgi:hypothetical protein
VIAADLPGAQREQDEASRLTTLQEDPQHDETDRSRTELAAPRRAARFRAMSSEAPPEYGVKARNTSSPREKAIHSSATSIHHLPAIG